jgi:hypothetical protein
MNEIFEILTDPAHWVAEVVMDGVITLAMLWPAKRWLDRHDKKKHSKVSYCHPNLCDGHDD